MLNSLDMTYERESKGMRTFTHKAGELIGLSYGEYSDYRFNGLYRCLKDIDLGDLAERYYDQAPVCEWDDERKDVDDCGFGSYLIAQGLVEEIPYDEIHCGSYHFDVREIRSQLHGRYQRASEAQPWTPSLAPPW